MRKSMTAIAIAFAAGTAWAGAGGDDVSYQTYRDFKLDVEISKPASRDLNVNQFFATPQQALDTARVPYEIAKQAKPLVGPNGRVVIPYQSDVYPVITCSPLKICDIELQRGEKVISTAAGDSVRWLVQVVTKANPQHIIIKPTEPGLETNMVVITDRRTYYVNLKSAEQAYIPRIAFYYPHEIVKTYEQQRQAQLEERKREVRATVAKVAATDLDFDYRVIGDAPFRPIQVFNDGEHTFMKLPRTKGELEIPAIFAVKNSSTALVNARVKNGTIIIDGVAQEYVLALENQIVQITRHGLKPTLKPRKTTAIVVPKKKSAASEVDVLDWEV